MSVGLTVRSGSTIVEILLCHPSELIQLHA